jgi:ribosomal protein S21
MSINAEITRNGSENALSVLRKFTRKVQGSGVLPRVRSLRYSDRIQSPFKIKRARLEYLKRVEEANHLAKLGKLPETKKRR